MKLTDAYLLKRIALSHLQSVAKYNKHDQPKIDKAKDRYNLACKQYDQAMLKQNGNKA